MSVSSFTTKTASDGSVVARDSITRVADTNIYAAGDAVSDNTTTPTAAGYFQLKFGGAAGTHLLITDITIHKSDHDVTGADFVLCLFTALPAVAGFEDNAAVAITDGEMQDCVGTVKIASTDWQNVGTGDIASYPQNIGVHQAAADLVLYGILIAQGAYTPASGEIFTVTAKAVR